ncbi:GntR family transcriptional regulator [Kitasatospora sp. NPDC096204]|uniref:GntR family transcriptional regulator n=1 Tax=Kitasatospora sp. NPDC096204 TaxID=3364094 RepID=UPI0038188AFF
MTDPHAQPYQRIVQDVFDQLRLGRLKPGDKLGTTRELADYYGVAPGTVQRALAELRAAEVIYSHQGKGSFVRQVSPSRPSTSPEFKELQAQISALTARLERVEKALFGT